MLQNILFKTGMNTLYKFHRMLGSKHFLLIHCNFLRRKNMLTGWFAYLSADLR